MILNPDGKLTQAAQDLLVQARFRNAILWEKMTGRTAAEVCREISGVNQSEFGELLNLKRSPMTKRGNYSLHAQRIADYFKMLPEDLFPTSLYALTLPATLERTYSSEAVLLSLECREARLLQDENDLNEKLNLDELQQQIKEVLSTLSPRKEAILKMRFGIDGDREHTLEEVGEAFNICKDRVRQIEASALRNLQHPSRSGKLRGFLDGASREYL